MRVQIQRDAVAAFFEGFVAAFSAFSGDTIAPLYLIPTIALQTDGSAGCLNSRADIAYHFQIVLDRYHADGCRRCRYQHLAIVPIGRDSVLASVTWELLREDDSVLKTWRESYNLVQTDSGSLQVLASSDHVE